MRLQCPRCLGVWQRKTDQFVFWPTVWRMIRAMEWTNDRARYAEYHFFECEYCSLVYEDTTFRVVRIEVTE